MAILDLLGALLTAISLGFLAAGGFLLALRILGEEHRDALTLAIVSLLAMTAEAVAIGLLLGALGLLRLELALALQAALTIVLLRPYRRPEKAGVPGAVLAHLAHRTWDRLRGFPALSLLALHGIGSEALRGLLRPPLSWDSLMYHLLLAGQWLQQHDLSPVFGRYPVTFFGYSPANGSIWLWWWLAPSHSELYVNLAFLPQWLLLGLATGGVARELGARRSWPVASFLVLMTPTVLRFATTQYVDILLGAAVCSAAFFALRWLRDPRWADAVLAGVALGVGAGTKVLGVLYAAALGLGMLLLARRSRGRRTAQLAAAALAVALLGSFFYLRNLADGAGPAAAFCSGTKEGTSASVGSIFGNENTVWGQWGALLAGGTLTDTFLGVTRPASLELGLGPQAGILLLVFLVLPFARLDLGHERRRGALLLWSQIAFQLAVWITVPYAANRHIFANVRYLIGAAGLAFAGGVALAEGRRVSAPWIRGIGIALVAQDLLQLHAEMPRQVRIAIVWLDLAAVALALSPALRAFCRRRGKLLAATAAALLLLAVPRFAAFRIADRHRAFAEEFTTHLTSTRFLAGGWGWLDAHGGDGTVDEVMEPGNYFVYPAMGPRLERRVVYTNINAANLGNAASYPSCNPRVDPSEEAWLANLRADGVRWVHLSRYPVFPFPLEDRWARDHPELFALRYQDETNRVYELAPAAEKGGEDPG